jgi:hypothetical protein
MAEQRTEGAGAFARLAVLRSALQRGQAQDARGRFEQALFGGMIAFGIALGLVTLAMPWVVDANGISRLSGKLPVWDFANLWGGGTLARSGQVAALFDVDAYRAWFRASVNAHLADQEWSYPPSLLLIGVPLSLLPLYPGFVAWTAGNLAAFFAAVRAGGVGTAAALLALLSPAAFVNAEFGQNGALTAALLAGGLLLAGRRPLLAGMLFGLLTIKPHLGLLVPVCLLASGNWRAIAAASATACILAGATGLLFGFDVWTSFLTVTRPTMQAILEAPFMQPYQSGNVTLFLSVRAAGGGLGLAYLAQLAAIAVCAVLCWRTWRDPAADPYARTAFTLCLTLLATPYAYTYDLVGFAFAIVLIVQRRGWRMSPLLALAWLAPALISYATRFVFPVAPLLVAGVCWSAWREMRRGAPPPRTVRTDPAPAAAPGTPRLLTEY